MRRSPRIAGQAEADVAEATVNSNGPPIKRRRSPPHTSNKAEDNVPNATSANKRTKSQDKTPSPIKRTKSQTLHDSIPTSDRKDIDASVRSFIDRNFSFHKITPSLINTHLPVAMKRRTINNRVITARLKEHWGTDEMKKQISRMERKNKK